MYTFEFLKEHELSNVIDIISQRIQWMDEKGMKQWNQGDYLSFLFFRLFFEASSEARNTGYERGWTNYWHRWLFS